MNERDELILKALDRELAGGRTGKAPAAELEELHGIAAAIRDLTPAEAPPGFTERVMARLPERRPSWLARLKDALIRPHVIRLNLAWETGLATTLLVLALGTYGWGPGPVSVPVASTSPIVHTRFIVKAPEARSVALAGDFNNWHPDQTRLIKAEAEGVWTVTVPLAPGRYKYMFLVDGQKWETDPLAESYEQDGFGQNNAVVDVHHPESGEA